MTLMKLFKNQKGAMFGLDARIALAIFAGLSVIAGAAIVNVIRDTGAAALATEMDNIAKGYINYQLETATDTVDEADIFGDYVQSTTSHPQYGTYRLTVGTDSATATAAAATDELGHASATCGATPCFVWIELTSVPTNVVLALEQKYDNSAATSASAVNNTGVFRYTAASGGTNTVYYQLSRAFSDLTAS